VLVSRRPGNNWRSQALLDKFSEHEVEFIFFLGKRYNFGEKEIKKTVEIHRL